MARNGDADRAGVMFVDRRDAGARLADRLSVIRDLDPLILAIPRGGVPVAGQIARRFGAELDVVVARKLGSPISAELAIGAVTAYGGRFVDETIAAATGATAEYLARETTNQMAEARRRERQFRGDAGPPRIVGRTVIVVDDGLATGATMRAAVRSIRRRHPARLIVAVPVGSREACAALRTEVDEVVCLWEPAMFWAVGPHYRDFRPTSDDEVEQTLREARTRAVDRAPRSETGPNPVDVAPETTSLTQERPR